MALVIAASGCASTGNDAPNTSQDAVAASDRLPQSDQEAPQTDQETFAGGVGTVVGAVGGGVLGATAGALASIVCGPAFVICMPVAIVRGVAILGEEGARAGGDLFRGAPARQSPRSASASSAPWISPPVTREEPEAQTALAEPTRASIVELGPIRGSDISPAGLLSLDLRSVRPLDDGRRTASLVVNFERLTNEGEMSYMAEVSVACTSGALTLNWWYSFETLDTGGRLIRRSPSSQSVTNERPGPPLDAAIRAICSHESKG